MNRTFAKAVCYAGIGALCSGCCGIYPISNANRMDPDLLDEKLKEIEALDSRAASLELMDLNTVEFYKKKKSFSEETIRAVEDRMYRQ